MYKKSLFALVLAVAILYSQNRASLISLVNSADSTADFLYDANGNMVSDGNFCYEYNDANQMQYVRDCVSQAINLEYVYDHSGRRLIEKHFDNGALTKTVYSIGKHTETVVDSQGNQANTTYFRANNELIAKRNADGTLNFYHQDHLGSTGVLTNEAGQLVESTKYYPYGGLRSGGTEGRYLYTGQEVDQETGLYYYGARFYNPQLKRFVAADSILPDPYDPQQLSRYTYVRNNPIKYTDPSGNRGLLKMVGGIVKGLIKSKFENWKVQKKIDYAQWVKEKDKEIRTTAAVVGAVPIAGEIWSENILYATGKSKTEEFVIKQGTNTASLAVTVITGGAGATANISTKNLTKRGVKRIAIQRARDPQFVADVSTGLAREGLLYYKNHTTGSQAVKNLSQLGIDSLAPFVGPGGLRHVNSVTDKSISEGTPIITSLINNFSELPE